MLAVNFASDMFLKMPKKLFVRISLQTNELHWLLNKLKLWSIFQNLYRTKASVYRKLYSMLTVNKYKNFFNGQQQQTLFR